MCVSVGGQVRPLGLFEVLARNRQSALGLFGGTLRAREQTLRMFTIPPRQQLSVTIWLAIRRRSVTTVVNTCTDTQRERERQINIQYVTRYNSITQQKCVSLNQLDAKKNHFQSNFITKQLTSSRGRRENTTHFKRRQ